VRPNLDSPVGWKVPLYKARSFPEGTQITAMEPVRLSLKSNGEWRKSSSEGVLFTPLEMMPRWNF